MLTKINAKKAWMRAKMIIAKSTTIEIATQLNSQATDGSVALT
jgi:hypothetical protein